MSRPEGPPGETGDLPAAPSEIEQLVAACVRYVQDALGLELDYTPETLPLLDHYLKERARELEPEVAMLLAQSTGAYFGEMVRRTLGDGRWHCPDADYRRYRLEFSRFFLHVNPLGIALEAIERDDAPGWNAHFEVLDEAREVVERSLEAIDDVRPEDYYTLSVRFEVLQQVAAVLSALESQRQTPRTFGPEVYRAATGEHADGLT